MIVSARVRSLNSRPAQNSNSRVASDEGKDNITRLSGKREKILEGALRVFLAQGYSASMDTIAAEAGVAKQTVYSHFKDKNSLFAALIDRLLDHFVSAGLTPELLALDARSFIRKIAQITLSRMDDWEYVSLLRLIIGESGRFPELSELYVSHMVKPGIEKLASYLRANDQMRFSDPEATARIIHGALINFVILQEVMHGKHAMPMSRERLINSIVDMVIFAGEQGKQSS